MSVKSVVYTSKEKLLLSQLVKDHKHIIESKQNNGTTLANKKRIWELICQTFNAQPETNVQRSAEQLRKLWNNLKQRKRLEAKALRHNNMHANKVACDSVFKNVKDVATNTDDFLPCQWNNNSELKNEQPKFRIDEESDGDCDVVAEPVTSYYTTPTAPIFTTNNARSPESSPKLEENNLGLSIEPEKDARVQKVLESTAQQEELHGIRMRIAEEEIQRAVLDRKRAAVDLELAELKLAEYKRTVYLNLIGR